MAFPVQSSILHVSLAFAFICCVCACACLAVHATNCSTLTVFTQSSPAAVQLSERASRTLIAHISHSSSHDAIQTDTSNLQSPAYCASHMYPSCHLGGRCEGLIVQHFCPRSTSQHVAAFDLRSNPLLPADLEAPRRNPRLGSLHCPVNAFAGAHMRSAWRALRCAV